MKAAMRHLEEFGAMNVPHAWLYDFDSSGFVTYGPAEESIEQLQRHLRKGEILVHREASGAFTIIDRDGARPWLAEAVLVVEGLPYRHDYFERRV